MISARLAIAVCCLGVLIVWASLCSVATPVPVRQLRVPRIYNAYITTDKQLQPSKAYPHSETVIQPGLYGPQPGLLGPYNFPGPLAYGSDAQEQASQPRPDEVAQDEVEEDSETVEAQPAIPEQEPDQESQRQKIEPLTPESETETVEQQSPILENEPQSTEVVPQETETESQAVTNVGVSAMVTTSKKVYTMDSRALPPPENPTPIDGQVKETKLPEPSARLMQREKYPLTFYPRSIGYYPHPFIPYSYPLAPQPFVFGGVPPGLGAPNDIYNFPTQVGNYPSQVNNYPPQVGNYPPQVGNYPPQVGNYPPQVGKNPPQVGNYPALPMHYQSSHTTSVEMSVGEMKSPSSNENNNDYYDGDNKSNQ